LAAPVALPGAAQLRRSSRAQGLSQDERFSFSNHPARLLGLVVPRAFDDVPERVDAESGMLGHTSFFSEYLADRAAFADSIVLGADRALGTSRRAAAALAGLSAALAAGCGLGSLYTAHHTARLTGLLVPLGKSHNPMLASLFLEQLRAGLLEAATLAAVLALV